jgi:tRNA threonylcarbamoyl adenosine modification protein YjeE
MQTFLTHSAEETKELGKKLATEILPKTLVCLTGDLGAGKTTFVQGFLEEMEVIRPYVSPTFVIMKQYDLPASVNSIERIYHADAYRVEAKDFENIGFAEWCADERGVVILEWPERVKEIIPPNAQTISFVWKSDSEREITIQN